MILLVLLVGTNPLPVWVAWRHLKDRLAYPLVGVLCVYTENTRPEFERLQAAMDQRVAVRGCCTAPGNPAAIRRDLLSCANLAELPPQTRCIHLHFTGGTKVMSVAVLAALGEYCRASGLQLETSYLDPRHGSGPAIVDLEGRYLVEEARRGVVPDLKRIALLNGFEIENVSRPPRRAVQRAAAILIEQMQEERLRACFMKQVVGRSSPWNARFGRACNGGFVHPRTEGVLQMGIDLPLWRERILPALAAAYPGCKWKEGDGSLCYRGKDEAGAAERRDLGGLHRFLTGGWLEYATGDALERALKKGDRREEYLLEHGVYVRRGDRGKSFELDVVALLGYQVVVVSCGLVGRDAEAKKKGMEALIRARQLGGDEARAVLLCMLTPEKARAVEAELVDEIGSRGLPLRIWGLDRWKGLSGHFTSYLRTDLLWN